MKLIPKCQEGAEEIQKPQSPLNGNDRYYETLGKLAQLTHKGHVQGYRDVLDSILGVYDESRPTWLRPNTTANQMKKIVKVGTHPFELGYISGVNLAMEKYYTDATVTPNVRRYQLGEDY